MPLQEVRGRIRPGSPVCLTVGARVVAWARAGKGEPGALLWLRKAHPHIAESGAVLLGLPFRLSPPVDSCPIGLVVLVLLPEARVRRLLLNLLQYVINDRSLENKMRNLRKLLLCLAAIGTCLLLSPRLSEAAPFCNAVCCFVDAETPCRDGDAWTTCGSYSEHYVCQ